MTEKPRKKSNWLFYGLMIILLIVIISMSMKQPTGEKITYTEFQNMVTQGEVTHIKTIGNTIYIRTKDSKIEEATFIDGKTGDFNTVFINSEELITFINNYNNGELSSQNGVKPTVEVVASYNLQGESFFSKLLPYLSIGITLLIAFIIIKTITESNSKNMAFGKSRARNVERSKVKFADVAGCDEEKEELKEIVDFLKNPRKYT